MRLKTAAAPVPQTKRSSSPHDITKKEPGLRRRRGDGARRSGRRLVRAGPATALATKTVTKTFTQVCQRSGRWASTAPVLGDGDGPTTIKRGDEFSGQRQDQVVVGAVPTGREPEKAYAVGARSQEVTFKRYFDNIDLDRRPRTPSRTSSARRRPPRPRAGTCQLPATRDLPEDTTTLTAASSPGTGRSRPAQITATFTALRPDRRTRSWAARSRSRAPRRTPHDEPAGHLTPAPPPGGRRRARPRGGRQRTSLPARARRPGLPAPARGLLEGPPTGGTR